MCRNRKPWLAPGGKLAVTECSWLVERPAAEVTSFWDAIYPEIGSTALNCERARRAGLSVIDTFVLPPSAWWDEYYRPLLARLDQLEEDARTNEVLAAGIAGSRQEIDLFRRFSDTYGYVFYLFATA